MTTSEAIIPEFIDRTQFLTEIAIRDREIATRDEKIVYLDQENHQLKEQLAWFKRQIFGKRSERVVSDLNTQQLLFEGFESPSQKEKKEPEPKPPRKKPNRDGKDKITLPDDLPVETTILDVPEEQKVCQETGRPLVQKC